MQRCSTVCRLLLFTPALFILLQVALVLHYHHQSSSFYDEHDYIHNIPTSIDKHFNTLKDFTGPPDQPTFHSTEAAGKYYSIIHFNEALAPARPSHSRAPPV